MIPHRGIITVALHHGEQRMKLKHWYATFADLAELAQKHGHNSLPIPQAMAALHANSRTTLYLRLAEMREAGWSARMNEKDGTLSILAPDDSHA